MKRINYRQKRYRPLLVREEALVDYKVHQNIVNNNLKAIKKDYGIFFTPERIVDFMVNLIDIRKYTGKEDISIIEPACGLAQFLVGIRRNQPALFRQAKLFGVEVNQDIINYLTTVNIGSNIKIISADYLLWQPKASFDLVIGNPPYGIPSLSKHYTIRIDQATKEKYKSLYETWYGKYNVYGAFIEKSIKLLKPEGQLILIVPPTFMILDEFKKLRAFLSKNGGTAIIYLGPDVFKPEAAVSSVILNFLKSDKFASRLELLEYREDEVRTIKIDTKWKGGVVKFETDFTRSLESTCSYRLGDIYEIRISPRTPEIKHNSYITKEKPLKEDNYLSLLNGRNLKCNQVIYNNLTGYWIKKSDVKKLRQYFDIPHIVVGLGFRENGKVGADIDKRCYPWMGDVYHLLRKNDLFSNEFNLSDSEIIAYLNSDYVRKYVKDIYREVTYHLSITQLKSLPLPTKKEWEDIRSVQEAQYNRSPLTFEDRKEIFLNRYKSPSSKTKYKRYIGSPLRYAGGKSLAVGLILEHLPNIKRLICPFFGGGSVEIAVSKELEIEVLGFEIFDILVNYWKVQIERPQDLYKELLSLTPTKEEYKIVKSKLKAHWKREITLPPLKLATYYYFNHNLSYGPGFLGWMAKIYENKNRYYSMIERVRDFNIKNISVKCDSFENVIPKFKDDFLYCDPPYYLGDDSTLFRGLYPQRNFPIHHTNFNHSLLRDLLLKHHKGGFILSYNDCFTIRKWYASCKIINVSWQYTMGQGETRIGLNRKKENRNHIKKSHEILVVKYD